MTTIQVLRHRVAVLSCPYVSCSVPGTMPRHSVVTEACQPHRDDVASRPFMRTGR
jgi:hypothetical protein